jgi:hypothetical protein
VNVSVIRGGLEAIVLFARAIIMEWDVLPALIVDTEAVMKHWREMEVVFATWDGLEWRVILV